MTDLRTAAQQALEALGSSLYPQPRQMAAIAALKAALAEHFCDTHCTWADHAPGCVRAEPVQEPFCYVYEYDSPYGLHREFYPREYNGMKPSRTVPLYTAPPPRKPLTEEEILSVLRLAPPEPSLWPHLKDEAVVGDVQKAVLAIARAIERAHGIGGSDD